MLQIYDVNLKVGNYFNAYKKNPRLLLLDTATLKAFSQSFKPTEKIDTGDYEDMKLSHLHLSPDISLEIVEVATKHHVFEVAE